ncbi:CD209 antigen-like protein B isoform X1 [Acipenser oxyrinchus oxyrinchus]|uniref:CD209 antigen-like protein B isoform X1 n=1 Tax=Acipenser oxyrinchus oxyrinchus TaxID=40147 RepID=A0AAD8D683_ACIOX|nr:CD209 antigen-like protein B isoform X1 [Acipenser oxyrinchus oxyrinchus]
MCCFVCVWFSCSGREDAVIYAAVQFAGAPSAAPPKTKAASDTTTADPTLPVSAAGKASSYRQPALVLLILCCLLLAAIISLAVYHFRTKDDPEKYTSLSINYSSLLNQLQDLRSDYSNLNKNHSELQSNYSKLSGSHFYLQNNYSRLNETHSELQSNYSRFQKENSEFKKNNTELSVKSSILDKYCPLKEGSSKERVCCPEKWVPFNGKCYYFSTDKMNWKSSRDNCTSMGGHLVIIESEAEQVQFDHHLYRALFLNLMKHQQLSGNCFSGSC